MLSQRLSALYRNLAGHFTTLVRLSQQRGTTDPGTPAEHTAVVLTALGPAFLHQLAFGPGLDASAFTQGLRALTREPRYTVELGGRKADRATEELGAIEVEAATGETERCRRWVCHR